MGRENASYVPGKSPTDGMKVKAGCGKEGCVRRGRGDARGGGMA